MRLRKSQIAERLLLLDGKPYSLYDYPFMSEILDVETPELLLKTARQVTKSTICAASLLAEAIARPYFKVLYVAPLREQTSRFSNTRLSKLIYYSPHIRNNFVDPGLTNNVLLQIFKNGSEIALSYAFDDPDRIRSISADHDYFDEVQDIVYDAVIPVVKECMSNSDFGYTTYAGTPKTMENTIEYLWQRSTKAEWIMRCHGCNSWQFVDSVKSIGRNGIICIKCGKTLSPREGHWYEFEPKAAIKGYHIAQPILPRNNEIPERWQRILQKLETYSEAKFLNEVLGMSAGVGARMIVSDDIEKLCQDYFVDFPPVSSIMQDVKFVVAGVDWSGSGTGRLSRTVIWVWGVLPDQRLKTLYFQIFPQANNISDVETVANICSKFNVVMVVGDAGEGAVANSILRETLGAHRVHQVNYSGGRGTRLISWHEQSQKYVVNRTAAIDSYFLTLKRGGLIFPCIQQMAEPIKDLLAEYESTTNTEGEVQNRVWLHAPTQPDDCLHAQIFGWLAYQIVQGVVEFY